MMTILSLQEANYSQGICIVMQTSSLLLAQQYSLWTKIRSLAETIVWDYESQENQYGKRWVLMNEFE